MIICVLLPSEEQKKQAGVRIRYSRLQNTLINNGHELLLLPIQDFKIETANADIYVVSKCYDARAFIVARKLNDLDKPLGVDLFDDYFSQKDDSRFVRLRYWLKTMLTFSSFILCSTKEIELIAKDYAKGLPTYVMNDPIDLINSNQMKSLLTEKHSKAINKNLIKIAWFGIGDNPSFPVGLNDLVDFSEELASLRFSGFNIELEILTNMRAMTPKNLEQLTKISLDYKLREWSEEEETILLHQSLVCFIPVNAQNFSRVKSLNRAVTALGHGCQVISVGFPLYDPLEKFIYRSVKQFIYDVETNNLILSDKTIKNLSNNFDYVANVENEAKNLIVFYKNLKLINLKKDERLVLIHGESAQGNIHKLAQKLGCFSVGTPLAKAKLYYDVKFEFSEKGILEIYVLNRNIELIEKKNRTYFKNCQGEFYIKYKKAALHDIFDDINISSLFLLNHDSLTAYTAIYKEIMAIIEETIQRLFTKVTCLYSEQSKQIPWNTEVSK